MNQYYTFNDLVSEEKLNEIADKVSKNKNKFVLSRCSGKAMFTHDIFEKYINNNV